MHATPRPTRRAAALTLAVVACASLALAADWPQFRGPEGTAISEEKGLKTKWADAGPKLLWRTKLGQGFSALSVVKDRIYTMYGKGESEFVAAHDAKTGDEIWQFRIDKLWKDRQGNGPRSTPTVHDGTVYAVSASGTLVALAATDGRLLWRHDLRKEYDAGLPRWGMSSSPVIEGKLVLLEVGGPGALLVAFDRKTGKEVWRSQSGKAGYSTPTVLTVGGVRQVVFFTGKKIVSVKPNDGKLLWEKEWETSWDVNAATPIFVAPDKVFISSGYDVGAALFKLEVDGKSVQAKELWQTREMKNKFNSSLLHEGHIYGFDNTILKCIDVATGETKWKARDFGFGSLIYADGHLIVLGDAGQLALVEATPEGYREKAKTEIFGGRRTWTMPTLAGGKLYLRDESEMIALDVSG